ncbi:hypothetical protein D3C85_254110 [compost metagenome]
MHLADGDKEVADFVLGLVFDASREVAFGNPVEMVPGFHEGTQDDAVHKYPAGECQGQAQHKGCDGDDARVGVLARCGCGHMLGALVDDFQHFGVMRAEYLPALAGRFVQRKVAVGVLGLQGVHLQSDRVDIGVVRLFELRDLRGRRRGVLARVLHERAEVLFQ